MKLDKSIPTLVVLAILLIFVSKPESAQTTPAQSNKPAVQPSDAAQKAAQDGGDGKTTADMKVLDQFLDDHADFALQVRSNAGLVNDTQFLQTYPDLVTFLDAHPSIRTELKQDPDALSRERFMDQAEGERARDAHINLVNFRVCLDSDPEVTKQLKKNPSLANDPKFVLDRYPELGDFLSNNPGVSASLMKDPQAYLNAAEQVTTGITAPQIGSCIPANSYK